jgi:hypothetical protein
MIKSKAVDKLFKQKKVAESLVNKPSGSQEFKKWHRDTEIAIERIFGENTRHINDFTDIRYYLSAFSSSTPQYEFEKAYQRGVKSAITLIDSLIDEIKEYWDDTEETIICKETHFDKIELIIRRFHRIARQLRARHSNRTTIEIEDEYDVQDLFHALLKLYFDDIRPEEYTPSYAGSASRVDFLLKQEKTVIEIKKTRKNLGAKEIGEQLIIDSQRYQVHPDCDQIICFVYDPEGRIANPKGIENDLTQEINGIPFLVIITPEQ